MPDEVKLKSVFLQLLHSAIWDSTVNTTLFPLSLKEWQWIYTMAVRQTLASVLFDVVDALPEPYKPHQQLRQVWKAVVSRQEKTYSRHLRTVNYLYARFLASGIEPVVLKGLALSVYYPVPEHRFGGDIDFFYGSVTAKNNADRMIEGWGIPVSQYRNEESICLVGDVVLENHGHLFLSHNPLVCASAKKRLLEALESEKSYRRVDILGSGVKTPNAVLTFLMLVCHSYKHVINNGIGLRQLTDIALFLKKERVNIQSEELTRWLSEWRMTGWARCLMSTLCKYLGMPVELSPLPLGREKDADALMSEVWLTANLGQTDARFTPPASGSTKQTTIRRLLHLYKIFSRHSYGEATGSLLLLVGERLSDCWCGSKQVK